jgi:hypothetical protein
MKLVFLRIIVYIFLLVQWGVESNWVHSALWPPIGLLCQPQVIMMETLVEWLARETEVLGENLPQCRFVHHKPHMLPGREAGLPRWKASDWPLELRHGLFYIDTEG